MVGRNIGDGCGGGSGGGPGSAVAVWPLSAVGSKNVLPHSGHMTRRPACSEGASSEFLHSGHLMTMGTAHPVGRRLAARSPQCTQASGIGHGLTGAGLNDSCKLLLNA